MIRSFCRRINGIQGGSRPGRLKKYKGYYIWGFPKMLVPNNYGVFLLKMIILGCFGGTTLLGNTHMLPTQIVRKSIVILDFDGI